MTPPISTSLPRLDALILSSPYLRRTLMPEGSLSHPYRVHHYRHTLVLHDVKGKRATFHRAQEIEFVQSDVQGIVDSLWGDGITIAAYDQDAGEIAETFRDEGRRHLVLGLKRPMDRGDALTFQIRRLAMEAFTKSTEWFETLVDRPVQRVTSTIVFPKGRPCQFATLDYQGRIVPLSVATLPNGQTIVTFDTDNALANVPYTIRWRW
jgi:hypothetical protein